jgi:hypothetical protein
MERDREIHGERRKRNREKTKEKVREKQII